MDAITHTILALASIAGAYYGGRWLLIREARRAFDTSPELAREIKLMNAIMQRMIQEDHQHMQGISTGVSTHVSHGVSTHVSTPLQLELFKELDEAPSE